MLKGTRGGIVQGWLDHWEDWTLLGQLLEDSEQKNDNHLNFCFKKIPLVMRQRMEHRRGYKLEAS